MQWHVLSDTSTVFYPTALCCCHRGRGRTTRTSPAGSCLSSHRALLGQRHGQCARTDLCLRSFYSLKHQAQLPLPSHTFSLQDILYEWIQRNKQWNTPSVLPKTLNELSLQEICYLTCLAQHLIKLNQFGFRFLVAMWLDFATLHCRTSRQWVQSRRILNKPKSGQSSGCFMARGRQPSLQGTTQLEKYRKWKNRPVLKQISDSEHVQEWLQTASTWNHLSSLIHLKK